MRICVFLIIASLCFHATAQRYVSIGFKTDNNLSETTIAVNPLNHKEAVAASNISEFFYSVDSGLNWSSVTPTSDLGIYGDPVLHYANGQLFYAHLSKTPDKEYGDWFDRIVLQKVKSVEPWVEESFSVGFNEGKMQDKPWLSSDELSEKYKGNLYVSWTEFDKYDSENPNDKSRIRFSAYSPATNTFSKAITISDTVGDCMDSDNTLEGAVTAVGRQGELFAVWAGFEKIYFDKSLDGGLSWSADKVIAEQINGWDMKMPHIMRANGMPFISYDPINNIIYVCWADERNGNADVWLIYSRDEGDSWSDALKVNSDGTGHQYFPNMVFNAETESVQIAYFDQELSETGLFYSITQTTFSALKPEAIFRSNFSGTPYSLPGERFFFGDYIDLDYNNSFQFVIYPAYSHTKSFIKIAAVDPKIVQSFKHTRNTEPSLLVDHNKLYVTLNSEKSTKVKGKIMVWHQGVKQVIKFNHTTEADTYNELVLAAFDLEPSELVVVKFKYKLRYLQTGKKLKDKSITIYP